MPQTDPIKKFYKNKPSGQKLLIHAGLAVLISIALGFIYAFYFMAVPADLAKENETAFRQGIGLGFGIMYLSPILVGILIVKFFYQLFSAKKLAMEEYTKELNDKYKK
jgi:hypothetical protein